MAGGVNPLGSLQCKVDSNNNLVVALDSSSTLPRYAPVVTTAADATSITPNTTTADVTYQVNTQAGGTLTINNDTGSPVNGQRWELRLKCTNAQTLSFGTGYATGTSTLPTTTSSGGSTYDYYFFEYNSVSGKWAYQGSSVSGALSVTSLTASSFVAAGTTPASAGAIRLGNAESVAGFGELFTPGFMDTCIPPWGDSDSCTGIEIGALQFPGPAADTAWAEFQVSWQWSSIGNQ